MALVGVRDMSIIDDAARGPPADPDRVVDAVRRGWSARRSCASWTAAARSTSSTTACDTIEAHGASSCARCCPEARIRRRSRADAGGRARAGHARLRARRVRRAGLHDDHRVGARHPERQHDHHRPAPTASGWRSSTSCAGASGAGPAAVRLPPLPTPRAALGRGRSGSRPSSTRRAGRRLPDRDEGPGDPRRRATCWAPSRAGTSRRSASTSTRACSPTPSS